MKNLSFRYKIFFSMSAIIVLYTAYTLVLTNYYIRDSLKEQLIENGRSLSKAVAFNISDQLLMADYLGVQNFFENLSGTNQYVGYVFVEKGNKVLIHSFRGGIPAELVDLLHEEDEYVAVQTDDGMFYDFSVPIDDGRLGVLRLGISTRQIDVAMAKTNRSKIIFAAVAMLVSIGISLVLSDALIDPLKRLTFSAIYVAESDYSKTVPVMSRDEVGQLTMAFNRMVEAVRSREGELRHINEELEMSNDRLLAYIDELNRTKDELVKSKQNTAVLDTTRAFLHHARQPLTYLVIAIDSLIEELHHEKGFDEDTLLIKLSAIEDAGDRLTDLLKKIESLQEYKTVEYSDKTRILDIDQS